MKEGKNASQHTHSEHAPERLLLLGCQAKEGFVDVHEKLTDVDPRIQSQDTKEQKTKESTAYL